MALCTGDVPQMPAERGERLDLQGTDVLGEMESKMVGSELPDGIHTQRQALPHVVLWPGRP